ncbi:hypothetical protein J2Z76_001505 [Sedimentibacter acidaminivorans]|uniref:Uncharacterized protein n=1 Tax=Sedimentibacter acidaminivorans TaxID=913099 RepID=A0ABS4GD73_9FIRM|nr:hypothetical protein [Sedimentibacter acidaminivorans]MBP1925646.1 hypothetical protein [Sedimentibacter acidaminivorans]
MYGEGFKKFYWGFLLVLIDFRLQGIDIFPDIIGFIFLLVVLNFLWSKVRFLIKRYHIITL